MLKNDYIIRLTEQIADVIAVILLGRNSRDFSKCHEEIQKGLKLLGLSRNLVSTLPPDELIWMVSRTGVTDEARCLLLVKLIREEALVYAAEGDPLSAKNHFATARGILDDLLRDGCENPESVRDAQVELISQETALEYPG